MSILQQLHDSEINATVSSFFDGDWNWKLGDCMNGFTDEGSAFSFADAEAELSMAACRRYPDSAYAQARKEKADA